jgi:hypothetical protein
MLRLFMFYEIMFWVWEYVMLKLFRFYEEIMFWMIFKVLDKMLDLFSFKRTWFSNCMISAWYSSEIYTG